MLVGELGEEALLERMRRVFAPAAAEVLIGIGDDAAVTLPLPGKELWTTDFLLEGVHFKRTWLTPAELGRKCLAVNLSDLAAMGAAPFYAMVSMACPAETSVDYIDDICQGVADLAGREKVTIIGGDTARSPGPLIIGIAVCGAIADGQAVLRSGARPGDRIMISGYLGSAAAGLWFFERGLSIDEFPELRRAFVYPEARLAAGALARRLGAASMTDVSDGLAGDLRHICNQSGTGARIDLRRLPVHQELKLAAHKFGLDVEELALQGGEDYELLITAPPEKCGAIIDEISRSAAIPVTEIGEILTQAEGILTVRSDGAECVMKRRGFDHFAASG